MDWQALNLLFRCSRAYSHRQLKEQGLSDTEWLLMSYVYAHEGCSQEEAARSLMADKTTVAKALLTLEAKGCVRRSQDAADKRKKQLYLTEAGAVQMKELLSLHDRWLEQVQSCLSAEEQSQFEHCCARLLQAAEAYLDGTRPD